MTRGASSIFNNDVLQKMDVQVITFFANEAAGAVTLSTNVNYLGFPAIVLDATGDSSQAAVDALLGIANDVTYATSFGSTAMGTDALGFVVNMGGQAKQAVYAWAMFNNSATGPAFVLGAGSVTTALPNTLTQGFAVTPGGNLYGRLIPTGLDAATSDIMISIAFRPV